jgi:hypothetical protein
MKKEIKKQKKVDIVLSSNKIKRLLRERFDELKLSYEDIVRDAAEHNFKIQKPKLSCYFNNNVALSKVRNRN